MLKTFAESSTYKNITFFPKAFKTLWHDISVELGYLQFNDSDHKMFGHNFPSSIMLMLFNEIKYWVHQIDIFSDRSFLGKKF